MIYATQKGGEGTNEMQNNNERSKTEWKLKQNEMQTKWVGWEKIKNKEVGVGDGGLGVVPPSPHE